MSRDERLNVTPRALLVRHTRLDPPATAGRCYGARHDPPLAATFAEEAAALRASLPWAPRAVWTSPARRCVALAERLADASPNALRMEPRLRELDFGAWEGRLWEDFRGPESESWALDPWTRRPPGGETGLELWARVAALRAEVAALPADARLLLVTHAGVIRCWRAQAAGEPPGAAVFAREAPHGVAWPAD